MPPVAPKRRSGPIRALVTPILASLAGFLLVASWGRNATRWPADFVVSDKLDHLERHTGDYDTLFLGRSHVFRSVVPRIVDAELARAGRPCRSFNLGGPGMSDLEIDHLLRAVLAIDGLHPRTIVLELPDWVTLVNENLGSDRAESWHTAIQTRHVLEALWVGDGGLRERLWDSWLHLRLWLKRASAFGQGKRNLQQWLGRVELPVMGEEELARQRGYQALESVSTEEVRKRRQAFLRSRASFPARVDALVEGNREGFDLDSYPLRALAEQVALVRAAGAELIYLVPPGMDPTPQASALEAAGRLPALLVFDDPLRYPGLYRFESRFDGHLTRPAAEEFSRILARALLELE